LQLTVVPGSPPGVPATDIVDAILDGRQPKGLRLVETLGNVSMRWEEQRESWDLAHPTLGTHRLRSS
jgi:hypothetical protein